MTGHDAVKYPLVFYKIDLSSDWFPTNKILLLAAISTGAMAFLLRLKWPVGVTFYGGLQLGYFASYVVLFVAGCVLSNVRWLDMLPRPQVRLWASVAVAMIATLPLLHWIITSSSVQGSFRGGVNVPSLLYALWEPFVAWGIILALLNFFQKRFAHPNRLTLEFARCAFLVYIIHPPVLVAIALMWRKVHAPILLKFLITGAISVIVCYLLAYMLLRLPILKKIF